VGAKKVKKAKKHSGGYVPGYYNQESDHTLISGEYVNKPASVSAWGRNFFDMLNMHTPPTMSPVAFSSPGSVGAGTGFQTPEMLHRFMIEVEASGLSKEAEMALVEKTSLEVAKRVRLSGSTAIGQPARFPVG
jgi:hypothetical protein